MERLVYRGRAITDPDIKFIRQLIASHPEASRRRLSRLLCEAWDWRQANGAWRDMVCRSLMLVLHRAGWIELPPVRRLNPNPLAHRRRPSPVEVDRTPLQAPLCAAAPAIRAGPPQRRRIALQQPARTISLPGLHPAGGRTSQVPGLCPGSSSRLFVLVLGRSPSSLPRPLHRLGPQARRRNLHLLAYNCRFLVLPWVRVPHLASHLLGRMARMVPRDWEHVYGHPIYYLETFVDPNRFAGTCYRAANWIVLGRTTGRGKNDQTHRPNRPLKQVLGLPLVARFRQRLGAEEATRSPAQGRALRPSLPQDGPSRPGGWA